LKVFNRFRSNRFHDNQRVKNIYKIQ
jgi:hypothetical protein